MRIYRNMYAKRADERVHAGFTFHASKADARHGAFTIKTNKESPIVPQVTAEVFDIVGTRKGIISALNKLASHPNNG